jgi:phage terminase small subunit
VAGNYHSGRKPKPIALVQLQGGKVRRHHKEAVRFAAVVPDAPAHIDADPLARKMWDRLVARLAPTKILNETHGEALAVLSDMWADYERVRGEQLATGHKNVMVRRKKHANGTEVTEPIVNPLRRVHLEIARSLREWLGEFGQTPMTQGKLRGEDAEDADPLEALLRAVK